MSWSLRGHRDGVPMFCIIVGNNPNLQGPVVQMPVSANPGLNFNPGFLILSSKELSRIMNDFPVIGYPCFAHRILGSPGGKHFESSQRNVWRGAVSPVKAVSLDRECNILP